MTAILFSISASAADDRQVPFKGSIQGQETDIVQGDPPAQILVSGIVTGVATQLGRFTMTYNVTVVLPAGSSTGSAHLIAANGDRLDTTLVGQGVPVPDTPGLNQIVEYNTVTGGTGRFANARGTFTLERLVDLTTGLTSGSFVDGFITSPGATR
jgi:hypothetical protein